MVVGVGWVKVAEAVQAQAVAAEEVEARVVVAESAATAATAVPAAATAVPMAVMAPMAAVAASEVALAVTAVVVAATAAAGYRRLLRRCHACGTRSSCSRPIPGTALRSDTRQADSRGPCTRAATAR